MKTRILIAVFAFAAFFFMQFAFASPEPEPEPTPVCKPGTTLRYNTCVSVAGPICGPGTTFQEGVCIVDKTEENSTESSSGRWEGPAYAAYDKTSLQSTEKHSAQIENIEGVLYYVSEPFKPDSSSDDKIVFYGVEFSLPYLNSPPRYIYSDVVFSDKTKETLSILFSEPAFTEHADPQAGFVGRENGYHFLVSADLKELSPLKQFKSGIDADDMQCRDDLRLVKRTNGKMACMKGETLCDLRKRSTEMIDHKFSGKKYPVLLCKDKTVSPEPPRTSEHEQNLLDARQKLREIYYPNSSLGPFKIQDAIVGFGVADGVLAVKVLTKYYESEHIDMIKQKIRALVDSKVPIEFFPAGALLPDNIESIFPYVWNHYLHQNKIEFAPKEQSYMNTYEGFYPGHNRVCSPIVAPNGTGLYISSTFIHEPFEITGTFVDKAMPKDCHKIWKTDTILVEPDSILALWLENYHKNN